VNSPAVFNRVRDRDAVATAGLEHARRLEKAGLVVERLREIPDSSEAPRESMLRWRRIPLFLHIRAVSGRVGSSA
jgi:hypothetical protein